MSSGSSSRGARKGGGVGGGGGKKEIDPAALSLKVREGERGREGWCALLSVELIRSLCLSASIS